MSPRTPMGRRFGDTRARLRTAEFAREIDAAYSDGAVSESSSARAPWRGRFGSCAFPSALTSRNGVPRCLQGKTAFRLDIAVRVEVLLDLDGDYFAVGHLLVEELDDGTQRRRDDVGNEDKSHPTGAGLTRTFSQKTWRSSVWSPITRSASSLSVAQRCSSHAWSCSTFRLAAPAA